MYTTNHRTVRVDESKGLMLLYRGIVTRSELVNVQDGKIIIEDTTFAVVKRIINYIDVEVLTETGWTLVEAGDETSLAVAFENMTVHNKKNKEAIIHEDPVIEPVVENTVVDNEIETSVEPIHVEETITTAEEETIDGEVTGEEVSTEETMVEDNSEDTDIISDEEEYADKEDSNSVPVEITMDTDKSQQNYNNSQRNFNKKKHRR